MPSDRFHAPDIPETPGFWVAAERYLTGTLSGRVTLEKAHRRQVEVWARRAATSPRREVAPSRARSAGYPVVLSLASVMTAVLIGGMGLLTFGTMSGPPAPGDEPGPPVVEEQTEQRSADSRRTGASECGLLGWGELITTRVAFDAQTQLRLTVADPCGAGGGESEPLLRALQ